jgi:hypothetical protein
MYAWTKNVEQGRSGRGRPLLFVMKPEAPTSAPPHRSHTHTQTQRARVATGRGRGYHLPPAAKMQSPERKVVDQPASQPASSHCPPVRVRPGLLVVQSSIRDFR